MRSDTTDLSMVGVRYDNPVIDPVPEHTFYFTAGALSVGIEFRVLNDEIYERAYDGDDPDILAHIEEVKKVMSFDDKGLSFHVCDAVTGTEYLRFDMFEEGPHYHYLHLDEGYHIAVNYDEWACGPMFDWAIECLRHRLPDMFRHAGQHDLADRVTQEDIDAIVPKILEASASITTTAAS